MPQGNIGRGIRSLVMVGARKFVGSLIGAGVNVTIGLTIPSPLALRCAPQSIGGTQTSYQ